MKRRVIPPLRGAANNSTYFDTPADVAPVSTICNMRPGNRRVGTRPPLRKVSTTQIGNGQPIQGCCTVARAAYVSGYSVGEGVSVANGESRESGTLTGQAWMFLPTRAMFRDLFFDAVSLHGAASLPGANAVAVSPNGLLAAFAYNFSVGGILRSHVRVHDSSSGALVHEEIIRKDTAGETENPGAATVDIERYTNTVLLTNDLLVICTNAYVLTRRFTYADGVWTSAGPTHQTNLNGWSQETIQACIDSAGSILVAFEGSWAAGTLVGLGGAIAAGKYAGQFRAGVMKFAIDADGALTQATFGAQVAVSDPIFETTGGATTNHGYFRCSERFDWTPRGASLQGIAPCPDGGLIIIHANQAWGPTATWAPDSSTPYRTITKLTSTGAIDWQVNSDSIIEVGDGGYYNDLSTGAADDTSLLSVCVDADGTVYVAGRRNNAAAYGCSVFAYRGTDGAEIWRQNTGATMRQAAIAVDPADGNIIVGGDRNNAWTGATGQAHLWKISAATGAILWAHDLAASVSAIGVACDAEGRLFYGTDPVP